MEHQPVIYYKKDRQAIHTQRVSDNKNVSCVSRTFLTKFATIGSECECQVQVFWESCQRGKLELKQMI